MGTRHLICIFKDGEYKVANYGQWDGYPSGQGLDILKFLRHIPQRELLKRKLELINLTKDESAYYDRDNGAKILEIISRNNEEISLYNSIDFAKENLYCEFCYVIDFDKDTFEVYQGFNKSPLDKNERFYSDDVFEKYYPVKFYKRFQLKNLPNDDDFIDSFKMKYED